MARRPVTELEVLRTEQLTPHMIRIVAGGSGLAAFPDTPHTDRYVKIVFPRPGVEYPEPFDMDAIHESFPREQWPALRTYTVRSLDHAAGEMVIDFVYHGDVGLAGPWAAGAKPGDRFHLLGPGGAYAPADEPDWHLLVGDDAALPAIGAALERLPEGSRAVAVVQVGSDADEYPLPAGGGVDVRWLHRDDAAGDPDHTQLVEAVRAVEFGDGRVQAFVHGEAVAVREVRRHLLRERGVERDDLSVSGYWRQGHADEEFRELKAAERAREQAEDQAATTG
ncbi:siderophore-interacting protein [Pseudonocardia endophytica]|uniref:NADPH-dependent ferric siderophore reductase n=1 Tax=Pseudonocardia endophytica TaxID=401976 RepID=A0A4R1HRG8_PSEEN|nr:siderophore-interacting protein [Pseudonocardia endophytica]TCK19972.1 NADPH-dependent ferric siderophore reductase [Pseudonocardia endophytica]